MSALQNPRHEAFAQARFSGQSVMDAYHAAGYVGSTPQVATKVSQHPDVKARLMELHNAAARVMAYERNDAIADLLAIIKAKPSDGSSDNPLCEVRNGRNGTYHRFPSKLRAMARLIKIMGWDEPPKVEPEEPKPRERRPLPRQAGNENREAEDADDDYEDELTTSTAVERPSESEAPTNGDAASVPAPLTPRQEAFARARLSGMGVMEAYKAAGYVGQSPERARRVNYHPPVAARLAQLRKDAEDAIPYKKHEAINDLIAIVHASPDEASAENTLCETRMGHDGPYYRFPCKLHAMLLLIRLMEWHKPEKPGLNFPMFSNQDLFKFWLKAQTEREERQRARKEAKRRESESSSRA